MTEEIKEKNERIANLQQENERLKEKINNLEMFKYNIPNDKTKTVPTITKSYKNEYEDYKSRCEKAMEYIKSNPNVFYDENLIDVETLLENEMTDEYAGEIKFISTLLNILNGSGEK